MDASSRGDMHLIDQVQTTERFEERLALRVAMPCAEATAYFTEAGRLVQWYAGGKIAWIDDVEGQRTRFSIGDDYETEWEWLDVRPDHVVLRQRIENSPPLAAAITLTEAAGGTEIEVVLAGEMSVFWKEKFLTGWRGLARLTELATLPPAHPGAMPQE
ncbi:MAG TPA: hypothetical protein VEC06_17710 [Paucimonas sp.]|nr:hypothetical protein [Paucimonas sp.]